MAAGCLAVALGPVLAQNAQNASRKPAGAAATRAVLVAKAHALEARGRPDMAIQLWQQILLSDPNNLESLEGLARDLKMTGSDQAIAALERLRRASPKDPNLAKIEGLPSTRAESAELRRAGDLARQGKNEDAMRVYRQLYGGRPPDGDIALAYFQTLYGTAGGKQGAIASMRAAAQRNPGDPRYDVALGAMLTYDPRTRAEGIRILKEHPRDQSAQAALRQALVWDTANPASTAALRGYVKRHPQDTALGGRLKRNEQTLAQGRAGAGFGPAEQAAFAAHPHSGRAAAGMGFLRMQQNNFADAITYLSRAEANGFKDRAVVDGLATSRFWFTMGEAAQALDQNRLDEAAARYHDALQMRPRSPEALNGLAGLLTKEQQYALAAPVYDQLIKVQPDSADGWRGLFLAYARDNQNDKALAVEARLPAAIRTALNKDPDSLRRLASLYLAAHRTADAERTLAAALELPFPADESTLKTDTELEYAAVLRQGKSYDRAQAIYAQLLTDDPGNLAAWMGVVGAEHEMGRDERALDDVKKMPPTAYEAAIADPGFLTMLGSIYQQANQLEVAQGLLERAVKMETDAGRQPGVELEMQLAGVYLARNDTGHAYALYQQVLGAHPERADAWKGLIGALAASNSAGEAIEQIALIPPPVLKQLDGDIEFVQTEAGLYAATGETAHAIEEMNRVQLFYARLHATLPPAIEIQNAWLLFNSRNDRLLYTALMSLGGRADLTTAQRETVEQIWANWSVRRAGAAMDNGDTERAVEILDAASQAFPDNMTVRKAVAGGYVQVGRARESLALYKTVPMQDATASDFQGAIGAALAANDRNQAELWLRKALERFQHDPAILSLAAHYEQARGDNQRAAAYYRASLAAMPAASPQQRLAHTLDYPEQDTRPHRAVTAADLEQLLAPDNEPFARTTKVPPLPAYGPDPYSGAAPLVPAPSLPLAQQGTAAPEKSDAAGRPQARPAAASPRQTAGPIYVPQAWTRTRIASQALGHARKTSSGALRSRAVESSTVEANGARSRGYAALDDGRPRLVSATFEFSPGQRLALRSGFGLMRTASFAPRAGQFRHAQMAAAARTQDTDRWKSLFIALVAANRNAEAFEKLSAMPIEVRAQLEGDVEFLRAESDLYLSAGEVAHAAALLSRAETICLRHRAPVPVALEVKRAFLLDNLEDDQALRPLLERLAGRRDLTAPERRQVEGIWAHSAVRLGGNSADSTNAALAAQSPSPYAGSMKLPPSEETVNSTGEEDGGTAIHSLPNSATGLSAGAQGATASAGQLSSTQYTPSAQEATTGAYSAAQPPTAAQQPAPARPAAAQTTSHTTARRRKRTTIAKAGQPPTQTPGQPSLSAPEPQAPVETASQAQPADQAQVPAELQSQPSAPATGAGLSDEELQQRDLPPLRGPWVRIQRQPNPTSPREEAEMQLRSIESGYSPWLGGAGVLNYRSGSLGYDHLAALEAPFEASMPLGYNTRVTIVARPVLLDSGQADGSSTISALGASSAGAPLALIAIPQPIGTLINTALTPPAQQNAVGVGGEVQLTFPHLALAGGYTPDGFLVSTFTGRALWKPGNGPFTLTLSRDSVKDTQLSYAGLRDPSGNTLGNEGQIWGGIVANQGELQFAHGDAQSGFYVGAGGQYLTGYHAETNTRIDGDGGAYWRIKTMPEFGNLSIGANFFGMHYAHNEDAFTYGMGGYFSPQSYFLANVPFTWTGHYGPRWHYDILGSLGVQAFQQQSTPLFPNGLEDSETVTIDSVTYGDLMLPAKTSVGPNYDVRSHVAYQIGPHWFAGSFLSANNSRNYDSVSAGFSVHYMFRAQPATANGPTGIFPTDGLRPFTVP